MLHSLHRNTSTQDIFLFPILQASESDARFWTSHVSNEINRAVSKCRWRLVCERDMCSMFPVLEGLWTNLPLIVETFSAWKLQKKTGAYHDLFLISFGFRFIFLFSKIFDLSGYNYKRMPPNVLSYRLKLITSYIFMTQSYLQ